MAMSKSLELQGDWIRFIKPWWFEQLHCHCISATQSKCIRVSHFPWTAKLIHFRHMFMTELIYRKSFVSHELTVPLHVVLELFSGSVHRSHPFTHKGRITPACPGCCRFPPIPLRPLLSICFHNSLSSRSVCLTQRTNRKKLK